MPTISELLTDSYVYNADVKEAVVGEMARLGLDWYRPTVITDQGANMKKAFDE